MLVFSLANESVGVNTTSMMESFFTGTPSFSSTSASAIIFEISFFSYVHFNLFKIIIRVVKIQNFRKESAEFIKFLANPSAY